MTNTKTTTTLTTSSTTGNFRRKLQDEQPSQSELFPSLSVQYSQYEERFSNLPLNSQEPIPVETELFKGQLLFIMKPKDPTDDPYWNEKIFSKKKRIVVIQLQGKLKYQPETDLIAGMEISDPMSLGMMTKGVCSLLLNLVKKFNRHMHYSFGDDDERAHICFPASTFFERLVVTPPGESPPKMGEEFVESCDSVQRRKAYKKRIDWNTNATYSMSFHSMHVDFPTWSIVKLPIGKNIDLKTFWGDSMSSVVLYEAGTKTEEKESRHLTKHNKYLVSIQMEYLGKYGGKARSAGNSSSDDSTITGYSSEEADV